MQGFIREFCANTSIHGVKYLGERRRSTTERLWWIIVFIASLSMCGILIMKVWHKWDSSPVIVSFAEKTTPVWQVPFPAVTICSENKARQSVFNFTEAFHQRAEDLNMTDYEYEMLTTISLVCDRHLIQFGNKLANSSVVDKLLEVAPEFDEMMFHCKWKNSPGNCTTLFSRIVTEEGVCYTFNMLDANELLRVEALHEDYSYLSHGKESRGWTLETGYPADAASDTYPQRGLGAGAKAGLTILLRAYEHDLDYLCKGPVQGFKVLLHHPAEIPQLSRQYFRVPLNQEVVVAVKPNMMTTAEGLRYYSAHRRQCYFPLERKLRFYKVYTQSNCELECLANFTLQKCGCVEFSMPRTSDMQVCGSGSTECFTTSEDELLAREIAQELRSSSSLGSSPETGRTECDCLPACTSIQYEAELSQADFDWARLFMAFKANFSEMPNVTMARVSIFFKEAQFITSRRSELYGPVDFLANCGGLMGLFMGVSLLSIIEIFYFITMRPLCTVRLHKERVRRHEARNNALLGMGSVDIRVSPEKKPL
ncbi:pickpocket protein 28 isoform X2 [Ctenocephalides felis]|nr:pickpocket protein 28 isoform X2 [Ctenocephalides felis]XP_026472959.1 pickpocket protein 28 isoform X2 [Ctenocephalides felis]